MDIQIAPSILSADFANLADDIKAVENAGADLLHVDVMDGHFVPNLTIGPMIVEAIRPHTDLILDTHLMISHPLAYVEQFAKAGSDWITFHPEAQDDTAEVLAAIKAHGKKTGVSIKPATDVSVIKDYLENIDLIMIMTVEPGFGGQSFMEDQLEKIRETRKMIEMSGFDINLEIDGGIKPGTTAPQAIEAGANILVAGSAIFSKDQSEYKTLIENLRT